MASPAPIENSTGTASIRTRGASYVMSGMLAAAANSAYAEPPAEPLYTQPSAGTPDPLAWTNSNRAFVGHTRTSQTGTFDQRLSELAALTKLQIDNIETQVARLTQQVAALAEMTIEAPKFEDRLQTNPSSEEEWQESFLFAAEHGVRGEFPEILKAAESALASAKDASQILAAARAVAALGDKTAAQDALARAGQRLSGTRPLRQLELIRQDYGV